jgi:hypothetical protein
MLVIRWWSSGKSGSEQEIKVIYPRILGIMRSLLISVIFWSSVADR